MGALRHKTPALQMQHLVGKLGHARIMRDKNQRGVRLSGA
jgi:hypothetical protein